jgi:hypothetical protein
MNTLRRKRIKTEIDSIKKCIEELETIMSEEQDCLDSYPENLQESERYENACDACDDFEDNLSSLIDIINEMEDVYF